MDMNPTCGIIRYEVGEGEEPRQVYSLAAFPIWKVNSGGKAIFFLIASRDPTASHSESSLITLANETVKIFCTQVVTQTSYSAESGHSTWNSEFPLTSQVLIKSKFLNQHLCFPEIQHD